jgi:hypothetical protein
MSFGYKVYANPQVNAGKYFLSKVVLKNSGGKPIHDLTVSYQVPDYIPWTTPEVSGDLPPGNSVVELYYPKFPERITHLANQTPATPRRLPSASGVRLRVLPRIRGKCWN